MQGSGGSRMPARMAELRRLVCEQEIPVQKHRIESLHSHYRNAFDSVKAEAQLTIELQSKLEKVKGELRQAEDAMSNSLAVKSGKEAKRMAVMESISVTKARVENLKRTVEDKRKVKDENAAILSRLSEALTACEEQSRQSREHHRQTEEAISWYYSVLGFRIECGHGVKFIFTNINPKKPNEEYIFTIRHENDIYILLKCDPHLSDTKELVKELNATNGLFKFVRSMREKFQEAAAHGIYPHDLSTNEDSSIVPQPVPVASVLTDHSLEEKEYQIAEYKSNSRGDKRREQFTSSGSSHRRSARSKVRR